MTVHVENVYKEIEESKDSGRKLWGMIKKLRGNNKEEIEAKFYDEEGNKLDSTLIPEK